MRACEHSVSSLVPRLPDLFNVAREKRGSLVKLITCVASDGTNFHIWHNSKLAKIKATDAKSSSSSHDQYVTIRYESASGDASVPFL